MKMNDAQQRVVLDPIGNLLVSAGAGSGKTSVMTERIVEHVLDGRLDLRRILVMTFTNAAASNMRRKIEKKLTEALQEESDPGRRFVISSQIAALSSAHISTIHSFCLDVIQNFGYDAKTPDGQLVIEPGFMTADQTRAELLLQQAADDVLSALYEELYCVSSAPDGKEIQPVSANRDPDSMTPFLLVGDSLDRKDWFTDFERMLASYGNHRNDLPLREMILSMYAFLRSMPDYIDWSRQKLLEMHATGTDFVSSATARTILDEFRLALGLCKEDLFELIDMLPGLKFVKTKKSNDTYLAFISAQIDVVKRLLSAQVQGELDFRFCHACSLDLPEGKLPSRKGDDDTICRFWERYDSVSEVLCYLGTKTKVNAKAFKTNARPSFVMSPEQISQDILFMYPVVSRLFETILLVDDRFRKLKRDENMIDFSDYEHIALLLLRRPEASSYYSGLFDEIYIDEYQDNSRIQERIVSCFAKDNCFAVGDVKQSIYRFRHAQPAIFLERMAQYRENSCGIVRELTTNYRSVPGIIDFVNDLFGQILSKESGELDYDETHRLDSGVPESTAFPDRKTVEFLLVNLAPPEEDEKISSEESSENAVDGDAASTDALLATEERSGEEQQNDTGTETREVSPLSDPSDDNDIDRDKVQKESDIVAYNILSLKKEKGLAWQDFAVLCRTNQEKSVIARVLAEHGIPCVGGAGEDFLSSRELLLMENLIRLLDNFNQDIPLASVMRSFFPMAGFSDDELLRIRIENPDKGNERLSGAFYLDVQSYRSNGCDESLRRKVSDFCDWIDRLRSTAMYLPVSELIERIYTETGFRESVSSLPNGAAHVRTLDTFRSWACAFDEGRSAGLYRFVTYVAEVRSGKKQPEELQETETAREAVTCTTIHKSKGLEYRIVFLTGLARASKRTKHVGSILLTERYGIAADYIEPDLGLMYPTATKLVAGDIEANAALAEDMRLLYVALTRAQEKLFLVSDVHVTREKGLSGAADLLALARDVKEARFPAWMIKKTKSLLDLCLLGVARNPCLDLSALLPEDKRETPRGDVSSSTHTADVGFSLVSYDEFLREKQPEVSVVEEGSSERTTSREITREDEELFRLQIGDSYRYASETRTAAKITVTELKRKIQPATQEEDEDTELTIECRPRTVRPVNLAIRPMEKAATRENSISAIERGTLLHSIFQYLDFAELVDTPTAEAVDSALQRLVAKKMVKREKMIHVLPYREAIRLFLASDLCRRMVQAERSSGKGPYREIPFSLAVPSAKEDFCLVQGMIDCWFIEDNEAVLLDYKTDRIAGTLEEKRAVLEERYKTQLEYYARAITSASKLPVRERIIWLIPDGLSFVIGAPEKNL